MKKTFTNVSDIPKVQAYALQFLAANLEDPEVAEITEEALGFPLTPSQVMTIHKAFVAMFVTEVVEPQDQLSEDLVQAKARMEERLGKEEAARQIKLSADWENIIFAVAKGNRPFTEEERKKAHEEMRYLIKQYGDEYSLPLDLDTLDAAIDKDLAEGVKSGWWAGYHEHY